MRKYLPDILAVIGASTIIAGVAMVHVPTAVILAGAAVIALGYAISRRGE